MRAVVLVALVLGAAALLVGVGSAGAETPPRRVAEPAPVASLEPAETARLWRRLVSTRARRTGAEAGCRPLRAVFYAATDWLRLATKLAASASPCAQYYISVPPIVGNKTQLRPNAASKIRALGSNFHAMAEIHFTTWNRWVASTGSSWYTAGVTARQRMEETGYDVAAGDTWVLNEISSAVRRGTGSARADIREFLRGLYEGSGGRPTRGAVFVIGVGQRTSDVSLYQTNLQNWFTDTTFWSDMANYVSDWSQEVYGDVRSYAVPGVPEPVRRDYLGDYLYHQLALARVGPPTIEPARAFLQTAFSPLANAAWERQSGYGWTMVPAEQMAAYVSAQVHALRYVSATTAQPQDHWGFAWAPRNGSAMPTDEFAAQSGVVLDRLAAAIRDSADAPDPADPGGTACGPRGQNVWCVADVEGAQLNEAWKSFRAWTQSVLTVGGLPQTVRVGTPSGEMSLALVTSSGIAVTTPAPLTATLSSSSPKGTFATTPTGPWASTLSLTIPAGGGAVGPFYYQDTIAGTHTLSASAAGATTGTATITVAAGPAVALTITPASAIVRARGVRQLSATGSDAYGNVVPVEATWSVTPAGVGALVPRTGRTVSFVARRSLGSVTVTAGVATEVGAITAGAILRVVPGVLGIGSIRYVSGKRFVLVSTTTVDAAGKPISRARVAIAVRRDGRPHFTARATTGPAGRAVYRVPARRGGCFVATVRSVSAAGFTWNGRTPRNRLCRPRTNERRASPRR